MNAGWPYDAGTSKIGDRPEARRAAGPWRPPLEAPAAPVNVPAPRAKTTTPAGSFPAEQAITGQLRSVQYWAQQANAKPCWMCGIRLPADQMIADGGSACTDLRWYCRDTWACTERWTLRPARSAFTSQDTTETPTASGGQPVETTEEARPVPV